MKNIFKLVPVLALATMVTACNDRYQEGFSAGKTEGVTAGRADGDRDGYARGEEFFSTRNTYEAGQADGQAAGYTVGRAEGFASGLTDGRATGFQRAIDDGTYDTAYASGNAAGLVRGRADGRTEGYADGEDDGFDDGQDSIRADIDRAYDQGYDSGYSSGEFWGRLDGESDGRADGTEDGYADGYDDGYDVGYSDGDYDGYEDGYDDGYYDGYQDGDDDYNAGFSVRKITAQSASSRANLLSKVHNDLIDYSKIRALKQTARGLEANGRLVFEEASMGSKDLEKRAAAAERYFVGQVANQIKGRFGLSAERSLQIAKVSNLWNKFATSRSVTDADADAYSQALIGVNLKDVERAVKDSMEGRPAALNGLLETAAQVNGTSPENVSRIMNQIFF